MVNKDTMPLEPIKTPCIGICKLDIGGIRCIGCGRSTAHLEAWSLYTDEERQEIMDLIKERKENYGKD
jgi:uncharacterized protein